MNVFKRLDEKAWYIIPLALFIITQAIIFLMLFMAKDSQVAIPAGDGDQYFVTYHGPNPPWHEYVSQWNGYAFHEIAENGYHGELTFRSDGTPEPSPWAFFPLFPFLCSILMAFGIPFGYAGMLISLACGLTGILILYSWIRKATNNIWLASLSISGILLFPSAGLFQVAYSEALAFMLLVIILKLVSNGKYLAAAPLVILLGLTRPVGVPDFFVFAIHGIFVARHAIKARGTSLRQELENTGLLIKNTWKFFVLLGLSGISALLWPLIGLIVTGGNAYIHARNGYNPPKTLPWVLDGPFTKTDAYPLGTWVFVIGYLLWALLILTSKTLKDYPHVLRIWPIVFTIYIFAVTEPLGNELRYLLLGFFILPFAKIPQDRLKRILYFGVVALLVLVALYAQYTWVNIHWVDSGGLRKVV